MYQLVMLFLFTSSEECGETFGDEEGEEGAR